MIIQEKVRFVKGKDRIPIEMGRDMPHDTVCFFVVQGLAIFRKMVHTGGAEQMTTAGQKLSRLER